MWLTIAYFTDFPIVPAMFWTVALIAQLCVDVVTFAFMDRWQILGPRLALFDGGILLLTLGLLLYCRAMFARGVLR
jgi:hypothetical protein